MQTQESTKLSFEGVRKINDTEYLLSSNPAYLDHKRINEALDTPDMFWAHSLSQSNLKLMLDNSFCLGLYVRRHSNDDQSESIPENRTTEGDPAPGEQIGLARLITDHVTFAWLTDVYILPEHRRQGLGKWIVEVLDGLFAGMPELRRAMLVAEMDGLAPLYERLMGCTVWENGRTVIMQRRGPAGAKLGVKGG